mmetsp:Transcript_353/g.636  ORF Transcript_353/g.636 Transcript_353/m.636 type:complete len:234 (-) Transcript_353:16-717(-)
MHPLIDADDPTYSGQITSGYTSQACEANPLVPEQMLKYLFTAGDDYIVANRFMILKVLRSAVSVLKKPQGKVKVTVKDCYPYEWWKVGELGKYAGPLSWQGKKTFKIGDYPGYEVRNVQINESFSSDKASTFIFGFGPSEDHPSHEEVEDASHRSESIEDQAGAAVRRPRRIQWDHVCDICDKRFTGSGDKQRHFGNRKHKLREALEKKWEKFMAEQDFENCNIDLNYNTRNL